MAWAGYRADRGRAAGGVLAGRRDILLRVVIKGLDGGCKGFVRGEEWGAEHQPVAAWLRVRLDGVDNEGTRQELDGGDMVSWEYLLVGGDCGGQEGDAGRREVGAWPWRQISAPALLRGRGGESCDDPGDGQSGRGDGEEKIWHTGRRKQVRATETDEDDQNRQKNGWIGGGRACDERCFRETDGHECGLQCEERWGFSATFG